jgi:urease subunit alpha
VIEVEDDYTLRAGGYGEEVKFGGGKTIRDGMAQSQRTRAEGAMDTVLTNALILDHWGIVKADIGMKGGRIAAIGKAGNPTRSRAWTSSSARAPRSSAARAASSPPAASTATSTSSARSRSRRRWPPASPPCWAAAPGPATGTFATTCTPGPWNIERMLQAADAFPMNLGFLGKGNASLPAGAARADRRPA